MLSPTPDSLSGGYAPSEPARPKSANRQHASGERSTIRSDSTTFAIVKGHEIPDVEEIVERRRAYDVVRKISAEAQEAAEKTDPRT